MLHSVQEITSGRERSGRRGNKKRRKKTAVPKYELKKKTAKLTKNETDHKEKDDGDSFVWERKREARTWDQVMRTGERSPGESGSALWVIRGGVEHDGEGGGCSMHKLPSSVLGVQKLPVIGVLAATLIVSAAGTRSGACQSWWSSAAISSPPS